MKKILSLRDMRIKGRRILVRVDFNVPLSQNNEGQYEAIDDTRLRGAIPTIEHILDAGGKCILASHLGRPKEREKKYSLEPVGAKLSELLKRTVYLAEDCIGDNPKGVLQRMKSNEVLLLENLRFHKGEEENSYDFASRLLELCDVFVTDSFGTLHRTHASTFQAPRLANEKAVGLLVERELEYLEPLRDHPKRPFVLVMGGSKVSDKIGVIENFLNKADAILIGGAMAYAFLKASGSTIGKSLCDPKQVELAHRILQGTEARGVQLCLPIDHVVTGDTGDTESAETTKNAEISQNLMGVDIGPKTLEKFGKWIERAETIFWNGPMGVFEVAAFSKGTSGLAQIIAQSRAKKMAGGGDVVAAISQAGVEKNFDFISTGGGATLEYLEGKELPGLKALESS